MILQKLVGHREQIQKILAMLKAGRMGQCFLFVGPQGIGKKLVARGLAQVMLCQAPRTFPSPPSGCSVEKNNLEDIACGKCGSCLRVAHLHSESVKEVGNEGGIIKIEEAREILDFLSLQSSTRHRVVIIDQAHLLNLQAANALLKALEEPPEGTVFFLIAPSLARILPTLRSRSCVVYFQPLLAAEMAKSLSVLSGRSGGPEWAPQGIPSWALRACGGSFSQLQELCAEEEQEVREEALTLLKYFLHDKQFLLNDKWRPALKDRLRAQKILTYWSRFMRDIYLTALVRDAGGSNSLGSTEDLNSGTRLAKTLVVNQDQEEWLRATIEGVSQLKLLKLWKEVLDLSGENVQNLDMVLGFERMWVENNL